MGDISGGYVGIGIPYLPHHGTLEIIKFLALSHWLVSFNNMIKTIDSIID